MIQILNSNSMNSIIRYLMSHSNRLYLPDNLRMLLINFPVEIRHLIFSQYLLPVADIHDSKIHKLVLFDLRYLKPQVRNIYVMCGDIDDDFLLQSVKKIDDKLSCIKKVSIRYMDNEINDYLDNQIKSSKFKEELKVNIGDDFLIQCDLFLD